MDAFLKKQIQYVKFVNKSTVCTFCDKWVQTLCLFAYRYVLICCTSVHTAKQMPVCQFQSEMLKCLNSTVLILASEVKRYSQNTGTLIIKKKCSNIFMSSYFATRSQHFLFKVVLNKMSLFFWTFQTHKTYQCIKSTGISHPVKHKLYSCSV